MQLINETMLHVNTRNSFNVQTSPYTSRNRAESIQVSHYQTSYPNPGYQLAGYGYCSNQETASHTQGANSLDYYSGWMHSGCQHHYEWSQAAVTRLGPPPGLPAPSSANYGCQTDYGPQNDRTGMPVELPTGRTSYSQRSLPDNSTDVYRFNCPDSSSESDLDESILKQVTKFLDDEQST
jgi:hypothetical protein